MGNKMNVNEFIEKFNSLSERQKESFLAFLHGSLNHPPIKKYEVIKSTFEYVLRKD